MNLTRNNSFKNKQRFEINLPGNTAKEKIVYIKLRLLYTTMKSYTIMVMKKFNIKN